MTNNSTLKERAAMIRQDTYASRAANDFELENKGRFVKSTTVVGATGAPEYPAAAPWVGADTGLEPPLGYSVEDQPPQGEVWEVQASIERSRATSIPHGEHDDSASVSSTSGDDTERTMAGVRSNDVVERPRPSQPKPNVWRGPYE